MKQRKLQGIYQLRPIVNDIDCDSGATSFGKLSDVSKRLTAKYVDGIVMDLNGNGIEYVRGFHLNLLVETDVSGRVSKLDIVPELNTELDGMADNPDWPEEQALRSMVRTHLTKAGYPSVTDSSDSLNRFYERLKEDVPELGRFLERVDGPATEYVLLHDDSKRYVSPEGELVAEDCKAEAFSSIGEAMKKSVQYGKKFLSHLRVYTRARP